MTNPVIVLGNGPSGLLVSAALSKVGVPTICLGVQQDSIPARHDSRTVALLHSSVAFLKSLGLWDRCKNHAEPLSQISLVDRTGQFFKAPDVDFSAQEIGFEAFGYSVPNALLVDALRADLRQCAHAEIVERDPVEIVELGGEAAHLKLRDGSVFETPLLVGADGKNSIVRKSAGIGTVDWKHGQAAIVCTFDHSRAHEGVSIEFHRKGGPFTTVPLPGDRSGLVWVEDEAEARRIASLSPEFFVSSMEGILGGRLGRIENVEGRGVIPLGVQVARRFGKGRVALIGEAGHSFPPIGAQGLNLSFRDAAVLAECAEDARLVDGPDWALKTVRDYQAARRVDVWSRAAGVDILNRSLMTEFLPFQAARSVGLFALKNFPIVRRLAMRQGMEPVAGLPKMMQPGFKFA